MLYRMSLSGVNGLAIEQAFPVLGRGNFRLPWRWLQGMMSRMDVGSKPDKFIWRNGRDLVTLSRAGDSWLVSYLTQGKLMGPSQKVYEAMHRHAKFAAWDVMAKVISASHDEDEGVEVAVRAAKWMRGSESSSGNIGCA